jgi:hypothetical protein
MPKPILLKISVAVGSVAPHDIETKDTEAAIAAVLRMRLFITTL